MAEPMGLGMSLDDLISKQQREQEGGGGYGKQRRTGAHQHVPRGGGGSSGGRGGRRGGRGGGGRGRGSDRMEQDWPVGGAGRQQHGQQGPRQQQQQQHQQQQRYDLRQQAQQRDPAAYRQQQKCFQKDTGEVVFRFMHTDIVRIDSAGNITLNSGGHHNGVTLASLNDALNLLGIRVTCPSGDAVNGDWSISDGRTLTRFADGVVLPAKGTQHAGRGRQMLQAFNSPNHAQQAAAAAASNAAATAAGILPFTGFVPPGVPAPRMVILPGVVAGAAAAANPAKPSVFARLAQPQQGQQAQRFAPY